MRDSRETLLVEFSRGAISLVAILVVVGCDSSPSREEVYPVVGRVLINDEPAHNAAVYFHPDHSIPNGNPTPFGIVAADGSLRPGTYSQADGLPAGEYRVTVIWPRIIEFDGLEVASDDRLQGKYANPERPILTVRVVPGENRLPDLQLQTQASQPSER